MSVNNISARTATSVRMMTDMSAQLDDLRRQLGTGKLSTSYAGLGLDRGLSVGLRTQLSAISSFDQSITSVSVRLKIAQNTLTSIDSAARTVKTASLSSNYELSQYSQTTEQMTATAQLDQLLAMLNTRVGDQYIFSGKAADKASVASLTDIMNGADGRAGLKDVTAERATADGTGGLGRLLVPAAGASPARIAGTTATLLPDAPAMVAGLQDIRTLASAGGTLEINGTSVTINAGDDAAAIVDDINNALPDPKVTAAVDATGHLVLTGDDVLTSIDIGSGTSAGILGELGMSIATKGPTNLLTQAATAGDTMVLTVGANPALTITFGTGAGEVATFAQLNAQLGTLVGGSASLDPATGNITATALNTTDNITATATGTLDPADFGILSPIATPDAGTRISLSEDVAGSVFGLKISSATSNLSGVTLTGPLGIPPGISADVRSNPTEGQKLTVTFNLPDGTTDTMTLTATTRTPPAAGEFAIGATPTDTAANLRTALAAGVHTKAATTLAAASAVVASNSFFMGNPPQRVDGADPATATGLRDATAADTVAWYVGENDGNPARTTATARIDPAIVVSYGMRANEHGIASVIASVAAFAGMTFQASDTDGKARYEALTQRIAVNLDGVQGQQKITDIEAEIAGAQTAMKNATDRHQQTSGMLGDLLSDIEGAPIEEVASKILTLQTRLQASYQTTSLLAKTSLVNYL